MDGKSDDDVKGAVTNTLYYNVRSFMWGEMKQWLQDGASIPMDADFKSELCAPRYFYRGGALILESKDDMKKRGVKSPNKADALALTFAKPVSSIVARGPLTLAAAMTGRRPATRSGY